MKIVTKPMSSPSRTEKFPPPLMMRFLTTNIRSKSRGRSRSSPMFIRKKNATVETQLEPSSPKVTCIGQVRVRRSSKKHSVSNSGSRPQSPARFPCSCSWFRRKSFFCTHFVRTLRPRSILPVWGKCHWLSPFGYCKKSQTVDASLKLEKNRNDQYEEDEDEAKVKSSISMEGFDSCSPPKNAFILTRCRSAPYRSSSLASRFWDSETEDKEKQVEGDMGGEGPTSESEPSCRDSAPDSRMDQEIEGSSIINGGIKNLETGEEGGGIARVLVLTRCRSEPARNGERLTTICQ